MCRGNSLAESIFKCGKTTFLFGDVVSMGLSFQRSKPPILTCSASTRPSFLSEQVSKAINLDSSEFLNVGFLSGHILAPILCHSFCNHMGFPAFEELFEYEGWRRRVLWMAFLSGAVLWCILLLPMTDPALYGGSQFLDYSLR